MSFGKFGRIIINQRCLYTLGLLLLLCMSVSYGSVKFLIEGNDYYSKRKIRSWIPLPKTFKELSLNKRKKWLGSVGELLIYEYESKGFFDVDADLKLEKDTTTEKDHWILSLSLEEGGRYTFGKVELKTVDNSVLLVEQEDVKSHKGLFFTSTFPIKDKLFIEKFYGDAGYTKRTVDLRIQVNETEKEINVQYLINPYYRIVADTVQVKIGKEKSEEFVAGVSDKKYVENLLNLKKGEVVSLSKVNSFKTKLKSTRMFNTVRVKDSILDTTRGTSIIKVNLEERVPGRISSGLFWDSKDGVGAEAGWSHKNILGRFYHGQALLRLAQRRQMISFGLANPLLFGKKLRFENDLDIVWRQTGDEPFNALLTSGLVWPILHNIRLISKLEFDNTLENQYDPLDPLTVLEKDRITNLNFINAISLSFLDDEYNPRFGAKFVVNYGNGGTLLDEKQNISIQDARHNWIELNTAYFLPVFKWMIWAYRLDFGNFWGIGNANSDKFFLGGRNSIRNVRAEAICPAVDTSFVCRTNIEPVYWLTSMELRMMIFKWAKPENHKWMSKVQFMQLVPFTDIGRTWSRGDKILSEGRGQDVGLGIRLPFLFFNLRFDYAVEWDGKPDFDRWEWYLDLAQAF